jgi:hypothetical protein
VQQNFSWLGYLMPVRPKIGNLGPEIDPAVAANVIAGGCSVNAWEVQSRMTQASFGGLRKLNF